MYRESSRTPELLNSIYYTVEFLSKIYIHVTGAISCIIYAIKVLLLMWSMLKLLWSIGNIEQSHENHSKNFQTSSLFKYIMLIKWIAPFNNFI